MVKAAGADTVEKVVDHFIQRFLRVALAEKDRAVLVDFLRGKLGTTSIRPGAKLEDSLRELLYLVLEHAGVSAGIAGIRAWTDRWS